jgi:tight adherence protein B
MNPEALRDVPAWGIALGLVGTVVVLVVFVYLLAVVLFGAIRRPRTDEPTLAELADPMLRARRGAGRFDARFDRLAEGTQLGITGETAAGWVLLGGAIAAALAFVFTFDLFLALFAGLFGGLVVFFVFAAMRNRRRRAIQEQLPDGCFQLARSLRSGLNLPAALQETSHYVPRPLAGLFARLAAALSLGEATLPAVRRVAEDAAVTEFDLFAEVLALNSESGGNLPAMLDRLAASIRDRNQYRGYFRSVTALGRAAAIFLALAAPVTVLLYLLTGPDQREMFNAFLEAPEGQAMIVAAVVLEFLGLLWLALLLRRQDDY